MIRIAVQTTAIRRAELADVESRLEAVFFDDSDEVDAVVSDTAEGASDALAAGKHVLLDALEAISIAELESLSESASVNGKVVMPAHVWRFVPSLVAAQSSLTAGSLGDLGLVRIHRWKSTRHPWELCRMLLADLDNSQGCRVDFQR